MRDDDLMRRCVQRLCPAAYGSCVRKVECSDGGSLKVMFAQTSVDHRDVAGGPENRERQPWEAGARPEIREGAGGEDHRKRRAERERVEHQPPSDCLGASVRGEIDALGPACDQAGQFRQRAAAVDREAEFRETRGK